MERESPITAVEAVSDDTHAGGPQGGMAPGVPAPHSPVMAWNEWDPLEEVIVGSLDGATIPTHHLTVIFNCRGRPSRSTASPAAGNIRSS